MTNSIWNIYILRIVQRLLYMSSTSDVNDANVNYGMYNLLTILK